MTTFTITLPDSIIECIDSLRQDKYEWCVNNDHPDWARYWALASNDDILADYILKHLPFHD